MSKILAPIPTVLAAIVLILQFFTFVESVEAQDLDVSIRIKAEKAVTADVTVSVNVTSQAERMWFMDQYGAVSGLLTERISHVYFYDRSGFLIARKRMKPNEMVSLKDVGKIAYTVDLIPRTSPFAAAHTSWAKADGGLLILDDVLPQEVGKSARVKLDLPPGWKATSTDYASSMVQSDPSEQEFNNFTVSNIEKAVVLLGTDERRRVVWSGKARLVLNFRDEWLFSADESVDIAASIFTGYEKMFGTASTGSFLIGLKKFPYSTSLGNWEGDTRGRSVTIVSSDMPFRNQSVQRLHEQLRHELFHLWIPNGVNLSGNYDWFYEGFALYQSLKVGVGVNRLRFEDFLDTLSRAYAIDASQTKRTSLIDASANRWSSSNTAVYARGMLLGLLCDIAMIEASDGKRSVTDLIGEVIKKHDLTTPRTDGNTAIIGIFKSHPELAPMSDRYVTGTEPFDIANAISSAGIEIDRASGAPGFKVVNKPSGKQKKVLQQLGIDNWKK